MLIHPVAITVLAAAVLLSAAALYSGRRALAPISPARLACGYVGAILACVCIAAALSYVSREEALTKWYVPAENYWSAVLNQFATLAIPLTYFAILGIAVIGTPVIFAMARHGFGSVPWVLVASAAISLLTICILVQASKPSSANFWRLAPGSIGTHLLLSLCFCIGAGLPWRRRAKS